MSPLKKFAKYAVPSVVSMWIFSLYSMVDGVFVARGVGPDALASVNLAAPFTAFIFAVGLLFAVGSSTVISIALGQNDRENANRYFNQNIVLLIGLSLIITVVALLNLERIARFLGATDSTLEGTMDYVGVIACFSVFFIVSYNFEVFVKVDGAPQLAMVGVLCCALMNVLLDYVFVMRLHWGIKGAALATGLAQVTSTLILGLYLLLKGKRLRFGRFRFDLSVLKRVIPVGLADGVTELSNGIVIFLFNRTILSLIGESGVVSYTVISYVNTLVLMTMSGIAQGSQPLISYAHGGGDQQSVHRFFRYGVTTVAACSVFAFLLSQLAAHPIVGLFLSPADGQLYTDTVAALRMFSAVFLLMGFNVITSGFFSAIEKPARSLTISLGRGLVLLTGSLVLMTALFGEVGIWFAPAVSDATCLLITGGFLFNHRRAMKDRGKASPRD